MSTFLFKPVAPFGLGFTGQNFQLVGRIFDQSGVQQVPDLGGVIQHWTEYLDLSGNPTGIYFFGQQEIDWSWMPAYIVYYLRAFPGEIIVEKITSPLSNIVAVNGQPVTLVTQIGTGVTSIASDGSPISTASAGIIRPLLVFVAESRSWSWDVKDGLGNRVDLSGHVLKVSIHPKGSTTQTLQIDGSNIALSSSLSDAIMDRVTATTTTSMITASLVGVMEYDLWDLTLNRVYSSGPFTVKAASKPT